MTYRHFIFDIDGTLLDTEQTGMLSLRQTIKEFTGKELSIPELLPYFGLPSSKTSQILGLADKNRFAEVWETHFQELMYLVTIFPGIEEILQKLKDEKCHLGIVTSRSRVEFNYDPNLKKIAHFFDCAICSDDTLRHKPFPDPVLEYLKRLDAEPSQCLYLGDTEHDYFCAKSAGIDFALADWKNRGFQNIPAVFKFSTAGELAEKTGITL